MFTIWMTVRAHQSIKWCILLYICHWKVSLQIITWSLNKGLPLACHTWLLNLTFKPSVHHHHSKKTFFKKRSPSHPTTLFRLRWIKTLTQLQRFITTIQTWQVVALSFKVNLKTLMPWLSPHLVCRAEWSNLHYCHSTTSPIVTPETRPLCLWNRLTHPL